MEATEHHIRTSHGDSETYYKNSPGDIPMSGEFQGKGDVATLFALESQTILNTHRDMTTASIYLTCTTQQLESARTTTHLLMTMMAAQR